MNRVITQIGQSIYEWFFTKPAQDNMVALGKLAAAVLGTSPLANGLACTPTSPASLQVSIGAGEVYSLAALEATVYGTLPADTTHQIIKQGISLDPVLVSCTPPPTGGQAINYLIQVQYQDLDVSVDPTTGNAAPVVLQFYNSSNPTQPWQGPNNSGQTSNTIRKGIVAVQAKAGIAATTGAQVTPVPDAGWTGLWVVTVANGQTTITAGNITPFAGAPILSETLPQKISQATADGRYAALAGSVGQTFSVAQATQSQHAVQFGQMQASMLGASAVTLVPTATTLTSANAGQLLVFSSGVVGTLPAASSIKSGQGLQFFSIVAGASVVRAGTTDTITVGSSAFSSIALNAGDTLTLLSNGTNGWYAVDGSAQLGSSAVFGSSIGSSGYQKLPSGLILQWGIASTGASPVAVTFPIAFPNACRAVTLGALYATSAAGAQVTSALSTTGFSLQMTTFTGTNLPGQSVTWMAIGN